MRIPAPTDERGAAVVEFAVLLLLLLVFVFGILEIGFIWAQKHQVCHAAREGGRIASRVAVFDSVAGTLTNPAEVMAAVETVVKSRLNEAPFYAGKVDALVDIPNPVLVRAGAAQIPALQVDVAMGVVDIFGGDESIFWNLWQLLPSADQQLARPTQLASTATFAIEQR